MSFSQAKETWELKPVIAVMNDSDYNVNLRPDSIMELQQAK